MAVAADAAQRVKVIAHGWDVLSVTPADVLANADLLDELPIDGLFLNIAAKDKTGELRSCKKLAFDKKWDFEDFRHLIPTLREMKKHRSLRHSFAGAWINNTWRSKDVKSRKNWNDDAAWELFANNLGTLARIVREGCLEGIILDNEDYSGVGQYFWKEEDGGYDEVRKLARSRGRQVFSAAFKEKPDLKIMAFWFLSWPLPGDYLRSADPDALRREKKDLWPDFVNGMLDVMPDGTRFIDGNETTYYDRADMGDTFRKSKNLLNNVMPLVEPENRVAYRGKLIFAPAHYLDSYIFTDKTDLFYQPPVEGGTRVDRFAENFEHTVVASDGYLWIYGERHPLIKWRDAKDRRCKGETWNEAVPGMYDIIGCGRNAGEYGKRKFLAREKEGFAFSNLVNNGACSIRTKDGETGFLTNRLAAGFSTWKHGKTPGDIGTDTSFGRNDAFSIRLDKVERGCVIVTVDNMKLGQRFMVRAFGKGGKLGGSVDFCSGYPSFPMEFDDAPKDGWRAGYTYVVVPRKAKKMRVILSGAKGETVWYDDIGVYADHVEWASKQQ